MAEFFLRFGLIQQPDNLYNRVRVRRGRFSVWKPPIKGDLNYVNIQRRRFVQRKFCPCLIRWKSLNIVMTWRGTAHGNVL